MADKIYNVLFICTGNSARSIIAEGLMNEMGKGRFKAYSAGSHPRGHVQPLAIQALQKIQIPTEEFRSKSWDVFAAPNAPEMDFVFTVCDQAAGEVCPVWPGQPISAHWGMPDPAAVDGPEEVQVKAYRDAVMTMKRRLELILALPVERLDRLALQREVKAIGQQ
ncbi:arsenate reductase ArsC [Diaphorobacter ruginosibacter]|uniref:Arsenate reductase ArsC n=1 Tax=Diaphorobacter ruginosibacter TaxID=1715720 RepID=A0A7G9RQP4_9BURK|nr:arsenate reductase ArsC [Diaphorobacter ruginosibacter]QNN57919.1 arsenate reductase ArsC [Diaphorobacter ruginosibacter]